MENSTFYCSQVQTRSEYMLNSGVQLKVNRSTYTCEYFTFCVFYQEDAYIIKIDYKNFQLKV